MSSWRVAAAGAVAIVVVATVLVSGDQLGGVRIELVPTAHEVLAGSEWTIEAAFVNDRGRPVRLVKPSDRSGGWRLVEYRWDVVGPGSLPPVYGCGWETRWLEGQTFVVPPGETRPIPPHSIDSERFRELPPGRYTIALEYSFEYEFFNNEEQAWYQVPFLWGVNEGLVRSHELTIDVLPSLELEIRQLRPLPEGPVDMNEYIALTVHNVSDEALLFEGRGVMLKLRGQHLYPGWLGYEMGSDYTMLLPGQTYDLPWAFATQVEMMRDVFEVQYRSPNPRVNRLRAVAPIVREPQAQ